MPWLQAGDPRQEAGSCLAHWTSTLGDRAMFQGDLIDELQRLNPGETIRRGGGASPIFEYRRKAFEDGLPTVAPGEDPIMASIEQAEIGRCIANPLCGNCGHALSVHERDGMGPCQLCPSTCAHYCEDIPF